MTASDLSTQSHKDEKSNLDNPGPCPKLLKWSMTVGDSIVDSDILRPAVTSDITSSGPLAQLARAADS